MQHDALSAFLCGGMISLMALRTGDLHILFTGGEQNSGKCAARSAGHETFSERLCDD